MIDPADPRPFLVEGRSRGEVARMAARLLELTAGDPGRLVVLAEDRAVLAAALLASLAGGPELILPHSPTAGVLEETAALLPFAAVLVDASRELPADLGHPVLRLEPGAAGGPDVSRVRRRRDEPFLHLYTGGSTGRSRVFTKTPANLLDEAAYQVRRFGIGPDDRILGTVSPCHIYGLLFSVLVPMASGATVVGETGFFLPREIAARSVALGCTVLVGVPAHHRALAAVGAQLGRPLRLAFSSGAPLEERDAEAFTRVTGLGVHEVYGSTETGGIATRCRAAGEPDWTPVAGLRWAVVGERLCVASPFLSPELPRDAGGLFHTGDRAEPTPGGRFVLLGRADGIVKVGGKRVDLYEVEEKLRGIAGVEEAQALALPEPGGRGVAVAALVVASLEEGEILERLRALLPPPAMPRRLRRVERIPLTPAGKRDRAAAERLLS